MKTGYHKCLHELSFITSCSPPSLDRLPMKKLRAKIPAAMPQNLDQNLAMEKEHKNWNVQMINMNETGGIKLILFLLPKQRGKELMKSKKNIAHIFSGVSKEKCNWCFKISNIYRSSMKRSQYKWTFVPYICHVNSLCVIQSDAFQDMSRFQ